MAGKKGGANKTSKIGMKVTDWESRKKPVKVPKSAHVSKTGTIVKNKGRRSRTVTYKKPL
jgi:hypothetical protein